MKSRRALLSRIFGRLFGSGWIVPLALGSAVVTFAAVLALGAVSNSFGLFLASLSASSACLAIVGSQVIVWIISTLAASSVSSEELDFAEIRPFGPGSPLWDRELDG